jgi:hypothetical protein
MSHSRRPRPSRDSAAAREDRRAEVAPGLPVAFNGIDAVEGGGPRYVRHIPLPEDEHAPVN